MNFSILVITKNEEVHLEQFFGVAKAMSDDIVLVDSFSTDRTKEIAKQYTSRIFDRAFDTHANQLNFALNNIPFKYKFVLRLDADEYCDPVLIDQLAKLKPDPSIKAYAINRKFIFMDKVLQFGGMSKYYCIRLFDRSACRFDNRTMDERILIDNSYRKYIKGTIFDHNRNGLENYVIKHLWYAKREAESWKSQHTANRAASVYYRFPAFTRAVLYFFYRYFFRFGFLDGRAGLFFHIIQGLLYRLMVDKYIKDENQIK